MNLTADQTAIRDTIRDDVAAEITPHAAAWDKAKTFPAAALNNGAKQFITSSKNSDVAIVFASAGKAAGRAHRARQRGGDDPFSHHFGRAELGRSACMVQITPC